MFRHSLVLCSWLACGALAVAGESTRINKIANPPSESEALFEKVMKRLLSTDVIRDEYPTKYAWPPKYFIKNKSAKEKNAYASAHKDHGATVHRESGKIRPVVMITEGLMKAVVKGDENVLAAIMGHELAHLVKDHVGGRKGKTALLLLAFGRQAEIEADLEGMRFVVSAGYPFKGSIHAAVRIMKNVPGYSSFEGLHTTHPTWAERLVLLDRSRAKIWQSMAAFDNGFLFLELEQFSAAEQCFDAVVAEFPDCAEGWANLGYAKLMRYIDLMEPEDLRYFDTGQIVAGSFYARSKSLDGKVRKIDVDLWRDAVRSFKRALSHDRNLVFAHANLGVAQLLTPDGTDAETACKHFEDAFKLVKKDEALKKNANGMASLYINAGIAEMARDDTKRAHGHFDAAREFGRKLRFSPSSASLRISMQYNLALLESKKAKPNKERIFELLNFYLSDVSLDSAWWPLAWDRYARIGKELGKPVRSKKEFAKLAFPTPYRPITSIKSRAGIITLSEPTIRLIKRLNTKSPVSCPLFPGSAVVRWHFADIGIDLLGNEKVLAVFLKGKKAPPIHIRALGLSSKARELRIGMTKKEFDFVLKDQRADHLERFIADTKVGYRFYRRLGLAVRFSDSHVVELAIAQVPFFSVPPVKKP